MLLGVYFIMYGLISITIRPSLEQLMADVREGTLDYRLTKPASAQFLVSFREVRIWRVTDLLLGVGLLVAGATRLGVLGAPAQLLAFPVALIAGAAIIYSVYLVLATLTFWVVRTENIMVIFTSLFQAGRYPVGPLSHLAARHSHLHRAGRLRHDRADRGAGRSAVAEYAADRAGGGRDAARRIGSLLALRPAPLHRRLRLAPPIDSVW